MHLFSACALHFKRNAKRNYKQKPTLTFNHSVLLEMCTIYFLLTDCRIVKTY